MIFLKNFYNFILTRIEHFKYDSAIDRAKVILFIFLFLEIVIFLFKIMFNLYTYYIDKSIYESKSEYVLIQDKINGLDHKMLSFKDSLDLISIKNIDHIEFYKDKNSIYVRGLIVLNDNFAYRFRNLYPYSVSTNLEPFLFSKNIPYFWSSLDNSRNYISEPFFQKPKFILIDFIKNNALQILFYGLFIYFIFRSLPGLTDKKYETILPSDIKVDLNSLVGMDPIIKIEILQLKDMILNSKKYSKYSVNSVFNIMFSGPAGTGKTLTATALAKALDLPMVFGTGNIETGIVGGGASTIKELFKEAERLAYYSKYKSSIIFLDEAQNLLLKRGLSRDKWADDSSNELLAQLDGVNSNRNGLNIIFIAASNFDSSNFNIDEAMDRRFKKKIFFKLPDKSQRREIIEFYLKKINSELIDFNSIDLDRFASITSGLSPAKIETFINEASLMSIRDNKQLNGALLLNAFERITIGLTSRSNTENLESRRRIVLHELGHFITEYQGLVNKGYDLEKIKSEIKIVKISSESISQFGVLGYVMNENDDTSLTTRDILEEEIISLYGGYASEDLFYSGPSNVSTGGFNDIEKISSILKKVVIELGMYSESKINLNILGLKNDTKMLEKIDKIAADLYKESFDRVSKNKDLILYLESIIMKEWVLDKDQLFKYIECFKEESNELSWFNYYWISY